MRRRLSGLYITLALCTASAMGQTTVTNSNNGVVGAIPVYSGAATLGAGSSSAIYQSGSNVGVGTASPQQQLHVASTNVNGIQWATVLQNPNNSGNANTGVGIQFKTSDYSTNAEQTKWAGITAAGDIGQGWNDYLGMAFYTHNGSGTTPSEVVRINSTGNMGIGTTNPQAKLEINGNLRFTADGSVQTTAWTGVLCGGDYAESMDVTGNRTNYGPGDLLVLDTDHPGKVLKSAVPYSTVVSGIYATKPGVVGRRQLSPASDLEVPMAMVGVVPTKVSAENGPIHVGDLLVSSSTPGHAMKGTDRSRMLGTVIGKAMSDLDTGVGVIEVLVTLQ